MIRPAALHELTAAVGPSDRAAGEAARTRHAALATPPGSLGALEALGARLSAIAGRCPPPRITAPALVIAAGDHGVHAQGVTPWPQEVTAMMVATFARGRASANALADTVGATVTVVDVGVVGDVPASPRVRAARIRAGTRDLYVEDAMTPDECAAAVTAGADAARARLADGCDLLVTGDMGIANTTPSAALISAYTGGDPATATGRGTGIDDAMLEHKIKIVAAALARHGARDEPFEVLCSLGGLEHAALVGVMLAGAAARVPVLLDGVIADAAALAAVALCPDAGGYLVAGHRSAEPGATVALAHLGLEPLVDLGLRLGEGSGALLAVPIVQAAANLLHDVATLEELGITGG